VQTQVTVQDGDMIAIGGIITDQRVTDTSGVPGLQRVPVLGGLFGGKTTTRERTKLIIFITPRIIDDTNELGDATDELRSNLKRIQKLIRDR
jgi:general secretion pathway protein D